MNRFLHTPIRLLMIFVLTVFSASTTWAQSHSYINGFCTDEDCNDKYEPATERNGWYEISNPGQLYWFAEQVDKGNPDLINANVRLINDIIDNDVTFSYDAENDYAPIATDAIGKNVDVNTLRVWNPIGIQEGISDDDGGGIEPDEKYPDKQKWFGGHFDGQSHSISGLYFDNKDLLSGLFVNLRYTAVIENVKIDNCYFRGQTVGCIAAHLEGGTINNCENNSIIYGSVIAGGLLGQALSRYDVGPNDLLLKEVMVTNCINKGMVYGNLDAGSIIGNIFHTYKYGFFSCLLNVGKIIASQDYAGEIIGQAFYRYELRNCYGYGANKTLIGHSYEDIRTFNSFILPISEFYNGKVAYFLSLSDEKWGQDLRQAESIPSYGGAKVHKLCGENYTNDVNAIAEHSWEDGVCTKCDDKQEAIFNTEKNSYEISKLGQLLWFDEWFGENGLKGDEYANAHLTTDITINKETLDYDGKQNKVLVNGETDKESSLKTWKTLGKTHTIEGNGHTISGFYGETFGDGSIQNLTIKNAVVIGYGAFGGDGSVTNCHFKGVVKTSGDGGGGFTSSTSSSSIISNCSFEGRFYGSDDNIDNAGGFVGCNWGTIKDCSFIGECFNLQGEAARIRFAGGNRNKIENCYSSILASNQDSELEKKTFLVATYNHGTIQNIAYDKDKLTLNDVQSSSASSTIENVFGYTTEQIKSGEVTYWLNDNKSDGTQAWYQKLGESGDEHPVLISTGNNSVYNAYQHGTTNQLYSNDVNSHKLAYNAEAEDEENGNHDVSYVGNYTWTDNDKTLDPTVAVTYTCKVCGKEATPQMTVEHDAEHDNEAATCTEEGHNYYKTSYTFNDKAVFSNAYTQTLPPLGHNMSNEVAFDDSKKIYQKGCTRNCGYHDYYATSDGSVKAEANDDASAFTVETFTLDDATVYDNKAKFTVKELTYKRTFKNNGWQAVYVPFDLKCDQINPNDYEVATINNFHEYEQEDGSTKVELEVKRVIDYSTIPALTPCLIRKRNVSETDPAWTEIDFNDVSFIPAEDKSINCASVTRYYQFLGSLKEKRDFDMETDFGLVNGELRIAGQEVKLSPQRWYLKATDRYEGLLNPTAQLSRIAIRVIGEGSATGIEDIHVTTDYGTANGGKQGIYDLQGRKLDQEPEGGIYIKNGKKYVK